jgi:hypothetical protein
MRDNPVKHKLTRAWRQHDRRGTDQRMLQEATRAMLDGMRKP